MQAARLMTLHRGMSLLRNSAVAFMRHLDEAGFSHAPELLGTATITDGDGQTPRDTGYR